MKVCIPIDEDRGLDSPVCAHFGSAPLFLIVDTESGEFRPLPNGDRHHAHGMCRPLEALRGEQVDGVVVGGIGAGALGKLAAAGISVYLSEHPTVSETIQGLREGTLAPMTTDMACAHGRHGAR